MSDTTRPVVVGVNGSEAAKGAARWAAAVAERLEAPLHIVHALPDTGHLLSDAAAAILAAVIAEQRESTEIALKSVEEAVRTDFDALPITGTYIDEPAAKVLTDLSRRARLVVLGSDEVSPAAALLVGSTTVSVAAHSACPVVAWRGDIVAPTGQSIVVGVDGSPSGTAALKTAFEFADRFGLSVKAVHAWQARHRPGDVIIPYLIDSDALEAAQWQGLLDLLAPWGELYPDVEVTCFIEPGGPSQALLHHITDSQLVVIGTRGRNLLASALLGSTSLNLLHHAPVPVMLCHTPTDNR